MERGPEGGRTRDRGRGSRCVCGRSRDRGGEVCCLSPRDPGDTELARKDDEDESEGGADEDVNADRMPRPSA